MPVLVFNDKTRTQCLRLKMRDTGTFISLNFSLDIELLIQYKLVVIMWYLARNYVVSSFKITDM